MINKSNKFLSFEHRHNVIAFIGILFVSLSIYNHTNFLIRPTEIIMPFILLFIILKFNNIKEVIYIGTIVVIYLLIVEITNNGIANLNYALANLRYWVYAIIFASLAKIFAKIDLKEYQKTIILFIFISIVLILLIYFGIYLGNTFLRDFFGYALISEEIAVKEGIRIAGVSTYFIFTSLVLLYALNAKPIYRYLIVCSTIVLLCFNFSRQFMASFVLLYAILFFNKKDISIMIILIVALFSSFLAYLQNLSGIDDTKYLADRALEFIYFYNSPSVLGRFMDTSAFIQNWTDNLYNFLVGHGLSYQLSYYRYYFEFDSLSGLTEFFYNTPYPQLRHNADNLLTIFIVEGGLLLVLFICVLVVSMGYKIFRLDKRLGMFYTFSFLSGAFTSVLNFTDYISVFTMFFIYFYSKQLKLSRPV